MTVAFQLSSRRGSRRVLRATSLGFLGFAQLMLGCGCSPARMFRHARRCIRRRCLMNGGGTWSQRGAHLFGQTRQQQGGISLGEGVVGLELEKCVGSGDADSPQLVVRHFEAPDECDHPHAC